MGAKNAHMVIYGARVTDAKDYVGKAKAFLSARSGEIGMVLEKMAAPAILEMPGPTTLSATCSCREKTLRFQG